MQLVDVPKRKSFGDQRGVEQPDEGEKMENQHAEQTPGIRG